MDYKLLLSYNICVKDNDGKLRYAKVLTDIFIFICAREKNNLKNLPPCPRSKAVNNQLSHK